MKPQVKEKEPRQDLDRQSLSPQAKLPVNNNVGRVKIDFYTDPLCCWSWAFEKSWRQLLEKYGERISYQYVMCGMIPDWNTYNDAMNSVSRPLQMGPVWMHASEVTHVKMRYDIWHLNPPSSSYPASIAVKTAALQSKEAGDKYLYALRVAMMEEAADISRNDVLMAIAKTITTLDFETFQRDWKDGSGKNAFREDMQKARFHGIGRFPTLTFVNAKKEGLMIVGYRPFEALQQAVEKAFIAEPEVD